MLDAYLGRCQKCARTSFRFMVASGFLALAVTAMTGSPYLVATSRILALASAGLWLAHLGAFALRAGRNTHISKGTALRENSHADLALGVRRQFIFTFARSFMFAMAATALPIRSVFAADCPCIAPLKCCWDYNGKTYVCAAADAVCCTSNNPWSCPKNHNCLGDSSCS